jgi:hypothetical protein
MCLRLETRGCVWDRRCRWWSFKRAVAAKTCVVVVEKSVIIIQSDYHAIRNYKLFSKLKFKINEKHT